METRRKNRLVVAGALVAAAGLAVSAMGQDAAAPEDAVAGARASQPAGRGGPAEPSPREDARIRFNFKDAALDQVLDFFSRECGLPKIDEVAVPQGRMTFISAESYDQETALSILNQFLHLHRVHLRRQGDFLYLASIERSIQQGGGDRTFRGEVPAHITPDTIITLAIPLNNSRAELVAAQIKPMVADYGGISAIPAQNVLIVVETADQCRRILKIVQSIDEQPPADTETRLVKLRHAQAPAVAEALKALVKVRERQVILDQKGVRQQIEEVNIEGLNFYADARTNSVLCVGPRARIAMVEELIALLDVPEGADGERQMMTFALHTVTPQSAAEQIGLLFAGIPAERKPTIIPLADMGKLTIVAPAALMMQAMAFIGELDPGAAPPEGGASVVPERRAAVVRLTHADAGTLEQILPRLLTPRQAQSVRYAATADRRGLIVSGPDGDVTTLERLIAGLDVAPDAPRQVRQVLLSAVADRRGAVLRAEELHKAAGHDVTWPVKWSLDEPSRTLTLIGQERAIDGFEELLRGVEPAAGSALETRVLEVRNSRASELAPRAARLAASVLAPENGEYVEPVFEPMDDLRTLIVRALPGQFGVLEQLIRRLDEREAGPAQFRIVRLNGSDASGAIERAQRLYAEQTGGMPPAEAGPVSCEYDERTGNLLVTASEGGVRLFTDILSQVQQLSPPARTTRVVDVRNVPAATIIGPLGEFLASADSIDPSRKVPAPDVRVVERTNSLMVTCEEAQHQLVREHIERLDRSDQTDVPPLRLLQLRAADVVSVSAMLTEQYSRRPQAERSARPVNVSADAATNTLIVSAHPDVFEDIKAFVADLNKDRQEGRITQVFPLKVAKAVDVAAAMERLYPEPPIPVDRFNRPMPWARQPKEVTVSADPGSNTLIVDAPAERIESLQALAEKLDRVELPPVAELKTYRIVGANLEAIARTLQGLSRQGNLSSPAQPGRPSVQVVIETEPKSQTLIVAGDGTTFQRVEQVLADLSQLPVERGLRVVPVANARAADVRERALAIYEAQIAQVPGANPVEVSVDESSNSLMVVADAEAMERFTGVMEELQRQAGPAREVRMLELRFAGARAVAAFLEELVDASESFDLRGGPRPVIEAVEATNTLLIAAQPAQFPVIEQLVRSLDGRETGDRPPMRILRLRSTDAANLAGVLQASFDRRSVEQRTRMPVDIQADAGTNTLIVSAHPDVLPEIEQIVGQLNETERLGDEDREIRIFPLKVARAEELARTIDAMYPEPPMPIDPRTRQPRPDLQRPREVVVRADRGTNSLIVDAPSKRLAGFEQIVRSLDQQKLAEDVELRTYRVERADLAAVATALRNAASSGALYAGGDRPAGIATPVTVDTEPTSRALIVSGPSEVFAGVEAVLKGLQSPPDRPATSVKMYALRHGRAERLQPLLQRVLVGRAREQLGAGGAGAADAELLVEVAGDSASNTLVISAPESVLSIADALVRTLDETSVASAVEVRVYRMTKGDASSAAGAISAALAAEGVPGDPPPTVTAEAASNTIVVVGTQAQIRRAGELVESMDAAIDRDGVGVRTIFLKHSRAEAVAPVVESVFRKESVVTMLPEWARAQYLTRQGAEGLSQQVRVAAERRLNAIVVSAPLGVLDLAEQIIAQLDADPVDSGERGRSVRVITLNNADAAELAANVEAVFADDDTGDRAPTIRVDRASNSLIVRGSSDQMRTVEALAQKLDAAALSSSRQLRMIPVDRSRTEAQFMAQTLKRLLEQQGGVQVEVITVDELLRDAPPGKPTGRADPAPGANPAEVAARRWEGGWSGELATFRVSAAMGAIQQAAPDEPVVRIAVDPATNSLIVVGSPRMTDRLAALAAAIEGQMPAEPTKVRIVSLPESADAQALARLVSQTVQQIGRAGPANPGGFTGAVLAQPDPAGGALIVWANDTDFASVGHLVATVARLEAGSPIAVKVYPLTTASAGAVIRAVNDLLSPDPRGAQARRVRGILDVTLEAEDGGLRGRLDPASVRMTADPGGTAVVIAAPAEALPLIDRLISVLDQSPVADRLAIRRYELSNAQADELAGTLGRLFDAQRQGPAAGELPRAQFIADGRTNSLLVTASEPQHAEVARLLDSMDAELLEADLRLEVLTLHNAAPTTVQRVVEQVVVGRDPAKKSRVQISAQDDSNLLVVRAPGEQMEEIRQIIAQVDAADVGALPVRAVKLERADAQTVAAALQRFFTERASISARPGQRPRARIAIVGDRRSGTLIVAGSDEDFEQVGSLLATFDAPAKARELQYRIIPLQHARVTDVQTTIQSIANEMQWERMGGFFWGGGLGRGRQGDEGAPEDKLFVEVNERINSVIVMGQGETLETMLKIVAELDRPQSDQTRLAVKAVYVESADLDALAQLIRRVTATPGWFSWRGRDPDAVEAQVDRQRRLLLLIGKQPRVEQAAAYIEELAGAGGRPGQVLESIPLRHAQADRAARSLGQFFRDRAEGAGLASDSVSIIGSVDGNVLMVSADEKSMAVLRDLVAQIDQPELGKDRQVDVYAIRNGRVEEIAGAVRAQFQTTGRADARVIVTPMPSTSSLIISALSADVPQVQALVSQLDAPPTADNARVVTVALKNAQAREVAEALRSALPQSVNVKITPVSRNNTLLLSGSEETLALVMEQIAGIDVEIERSPVEFKRVRLKNAIAIDVSYTLRQMLRSRPRVPGEPEPVIDYSTMENTLSFSGTSDQIKAIDMMIEALDVAPDSTRTTEFVKLQFARAEATSKALEVFYGRYAREPATPGALNVTIVPDPASNSLVVSADQAEWEGIRALLQKLDTEDYDTSRQLVVIQLKHADAASVAKALSDGFRAPLEDRLRTQRLGRPQRPGQQGQQESREEMLAEPTVLVDAEGTPSVTAEQQTNSLIIFAGRQDLERIEALIAQIDVPDFLRLPPAHVLALGTGKASTIAASIRQLFPERQARPGMGPRSVVIIGDDAAGALIVRAEEADWAQIKALAQALQDQGGLGQASVRVLALRNVPAARLQRTISATFAETAKQLGEPLAVEVDRDSNALVIASSQRLYDQIERVVRELDGALPPDGGDEAVLPRPGLGQGVFIIDVQNNSPEEVRELLEQMGLTRPAPQDRPGVVSEPVTIVPLRTRRAIAVIAGPHDGEAVTALVRALDAEPAAAQQHVEIVSLRLATAGPLVETLKGMLDPAEQSAQTGPARALAEQVRRRTVLRSGGDGKDVTVDLSRPITLVADAQTNSVMIGSTAENVRALADLIRVLDTLPIGDAVVVRLFPLENASALRTKAVLDDLFRQGEALRRLPGTDRRGLPSTATGQALAGELAVSVDDRTNTLIVAGREEAVALAEVLVRGLDSDESSKWVEPTLIALRHADAVSLAATLRRVLVEGTTQAPDAIGLQRQIGRLRMVRAGKALDDPAARIEADLFSPLTGLVITAEEQLNAIIVVGTPANAQIVLELVSMLDVEAASAANTVRMFPLRYAAADRIAAVVGDLFRQREQAGERRAEDRLVIASDARTNSLIVSTSPRSFSILEGLLVSLDSEFASNTVSLHVLPVAGADVESLAPKITRLMRDRIAATQQSGAVRSPMDTFAIEADPANSLLIVAASEENMQIVRELVATLSQGNAALAGAARTELVQVSSGRAADAAQAVRELYADKENARRGAGSVGIIANERLNALIVSGSERDVAEVRALVERLGNAPVMAEQEIQRIGLRSANALEVVNLLREVLAGRPVTGARGPSQALNLRFIRDHVASHVEGEIGRPPTEAQVDGAVRELVALTPDLRTNSVMVSAPPELMRLIKDIVLDLDTTSSGARRMESFQLKNADARQMALLLRDAFNLQQQGGRLVLVPSQPTDAAEGEGPSPTMVTPVPDERQALSIAIDPRTNTLIVTGTEEYLAMVAKLVNDLDRIEANERDRRVYALKNAKAKEIEQTLQSYFSGESRLQRDLLGVDQSGSVMRQLEQEVTVVGDEKSNKLVISTSPRYMDMVVRMVDELDAAPPQVIIHVLLAEVTLDSGKAWGADVRVKHFGGDDYNFAALAAGAGVATALGVPNLTFASADFNLILRALEVQGKLQVLSRPFVQARNNEPASVQVGDNIAIVQGVELLPQGGVRSQVVRQDVGIILNVTPSISPDGFVRMDVAPEISSLSQRTVQLSEDFQAPVIQQRRVNTTVTVKDGQTIVIGGLFQTQQEERKTKVPLLGDIPLLGALFRTTEAQDVKTELLVILTPRVIYGDGPLDVEHLRTLSDEKIELLQNPAAVLQTIEREHGYRPPPGPPGEAPPADAPAEMPRDMPVEPEMLPPPRPGKNPR